MISSKKQMPKPLSKVPEKKHVHFEEPPKTPKTGVTPVNPNREAFLRQNEIERKNLDREIAMLERKLGLKDVKKRRKLN